MVVQNGLLYGSPEGSTQMAKGSKLGLLFQSLFSNQVDLIRYLLGPFFQVCTSACIRHELAGLQTARYPIMHFTLARGSNSNSGKCVFFKVQKYELQQLIRPCLQLKQPLCMCFVFVFVLILLGHRRTKPHKI